MRIIKSWIAGTAFRSTPQRPPPKPREIQSRR